MYTPITRSKSCPYVPQKNRIIVDVNDVENLVSQNLSDIFNSCCNIPCTPIKVSDVIEPVILLSEFNFVNRD